MSGNSIKAEDYNADEHVFEEIDPNEENTNYNFDDIKIEIKEEPMVDHNEADKIMEYTNNFNSMFEQKTSNMNQDSVLRLLPFDSKASVPSVLEHVNDKTEHYLNVPINNKLYTFGKLNMPAHSYKVKNENKEDIFLETNAVFIKGLPDNQTNLFVDENGEGKFSQSQNKDEHAFDANLRCASCPFITNRKQYLIQHLALHKKYNEIEYHRCPHCDYSSLHKKNTQRHMAVHKKYVFECAHCEFKTKYSHSLKKHMLYHGDGEKMYKCPLCPFQTPHLDTLKNSHRFTHKSDKKTRIYKSKFCLHEGKTPSLLEEHQNVHDKPAYYCIELPLLQCNQCDFQTQKRYGLKKHYYRAHSNPEEIRWFKCDKCDYETKYFSYLKIHVLAQHKYDFECELCEFKTNVSARFSRHRMEKHREIYMNEYIFQCNMCNFATKRKYNIKRRRKMVHSSSSEKKS